MTIMVDKEMELTAHDSQVVQVPPEPVDEETTRQFEKLAKDVEENNEEIKAVSRPVRLIDKLAIFIR